MADRTETIDTRLTRVIRGSPIKLLLLVVIGVALVAVCLSLALDVFPQDGSDREAGVLIGWIGTAFFGVCLAAIVLRLAEWNKPVLEISPTGILDRRSFRQVVPWTDVTDIGMWTSRGASFVQLAVTEETEQRIFKSPLARTLRLANKAVGFSGLAVNAAGLAIETDALARLCDAYWRAHGNTEGETTHV